MITPLNGLVRPLKSVGPARQYRSLRDLPYFACHLHFHSVAIGGYLENTSRANPNPEGFISTLLPET